MTIRKAMVVATLCALGFSGAVEAKTFRFGHGQPAGQPRDQAPAPAAPAIPEDFPVDFATEVFCPGPLLHQLSTYLPYGADTLGIVGEYYWIARERGTIEAARNRASFPLRYTQAGERREVAVRIRRNTAGGLGAAWTIDKVNAPVE